MRKTGCLEIENEFLDKLPLSVIINLTTFLYISVFGLIAFVIIRVIINSNKGIIYFPDDENSKEQINLAKQNLCEIWGIEPPTFWVPLDGDSSINICYFNLDEFDENFGLIKLSQLVNSFEKGEIYSFRESQEFSQIDKLMIETYSGLDTFYSNLTSDWVIYITHENTITFGGFAIINALKAEWIELDKFINPWEK